MDKEALLAAAKVIVARNVTEHVVAAGVDYPVSTRRLTVTYLTAGEPTEDDEEWCELSVTELVAEFPDILKVRSNCLADTPANRTALGDVVFP